jgi:hypothetical protein
MAEQEITLSIKSCLKLKNQQSNLYAFNRIYKVRTVEEVWSLIK